MRKAKQLYLPTFSNQSSAYGGSILVGKRKLARPISTKRPMHIVIKASSPIFLKHLRKHQNLLQRFSKRFQIKIYGSVFNGNHVHLVLGIYNRKQYKEFIRALTGGMAQVAQKSKLFLSRPFTRFISWGKDFKNIRSYLHLNELEADGINRKNGRVLTSIWATDPPI